jgi:hypothetical protein
VKVKTIAYYALHYGSEYLAWSVRSIQHAVDEIHVLYSAKPSFGHGTRLPCPDTEERLVTEARRFLDNQSKLHWHRIEDAGNEGQHRDRLRSLTDAKMVVHVDADEVWDPESLADSIVHARELGIYSHRARFVHFWRSFGHLCEDQAWPERIFDWRKVHHSTGYISRQAQRVPVLHFGYAQSELLMRYKWQIHGHQNELRQGWLEQKFIPWVPGINDVHPTCVDFWNPKPTPEELKPVLQRLLGDHPYFGQELIL